MPEARSGRRRGLHLVKRDLAILETLVVRRAGYPRTVRIGQDENAW